jgi:hypothetical protein
VTVELHITRPQPAKPNFSTHVVSPVTGERLPGVLVQKALPGHSDGPYFLLGEEGWDGMALYRTHFGSMNNVWNVKQEIDGIPDVPIIWGRYHKEFLAVEW